MELCLGGEYDLVKEVTNDITNTLGRVVLISTAVPVLYTSPPYNFDSIDIGLFSLASFVGTFISYSLAGPVTDWISRRFAQHNGGVHRPEHRLPALIFPFIICSCGLLLFAFSTAKRESYIVPGLDLQCTLWD